MKTWKRSGSRWKHAVGLVRWCSTPGHLKLLLVVLILAVAAVSSRLSALQFEAVDFGLKESIEIPLPPPLRVFRQYQQWHGRNILEREWQGNSDSFNHRRYSIVYYSCPHQAGNRLFHFFNAVVWSIVTNRTLLYQYFDRETCQSVLEPEHAAWNGYDPHVCDYTTSAVGEEPCDEVLHRANWIPSWADWKGRLVAKGSDHIVKRLDYWTTRPPPELQTLKQKRSNAKRGHPPWDPAWFRGKTFAHVDATDERIVEFPVMLGMSGSLVDENRVS
jgi:hypothetical protein